VRIDKNPADAQAAAAQVQMCTTAHRLNWLRRLALEAQIAAMTHSQKHLKVFHATLQVCLSLEVKGAVTGPTFEKVHDSQMEVQKVVVAEGKNQTMHGHALPGVGSILRRKLGVEHDPVGVKLVMKDEDSAQACSLSPGVPDSISKPCCVLALA